MLTLWLSQCCLFLSLLEALFHVIQPFCADVGGEKKSNVHSSGLLWERRRGAGDVMNCFLWLEGMEERGMRAAGHFIYVGALTLLPTKTVSTYKKSWYMHIVHQQQPAISANVRGNLENEIFMWWIRWIIKSSEPCSVLLFRSSWTLSVRLHSPSRSVRA